MSFLYNLEQKSLRLSLIVNNQSFNTTKIDVSLVGPIETTIINKIIPNKQNINIRLYSEYSIFDKISRIYIIDLVGSSINQETRGCGFGTLLFNTLLQFLKKNYPSNTEVYGNIVGEDEINKTYIINFWKRFGFNIIQNELNSDQKIVSNLSELRINKSPKTFNEVWGAFIPLEYLIKE